MKKFEIVNPVEYSQWDNLVLQAKEYSFFHSSGWAEVLRRSYDYRPLYFTSTEEGKLLALIPIMEVKSLLTGKRGVSLSFADYCEPIGTNAEAFTALFNHVIDFGRKRGWRHIELRGGESFLAAAPASDEYLCHTLELSGNEESLLSRFRHSTRINIKKAIREGVEIRISTAFQAIKDFYELHCMTRKRHGVPPQPFHFFRNIHEILIAKNSGLVLLASYRERPIAGAVCFHFGNKAIYKYGASDNSYQQLRANNLITWEAIKWYSGNGYAAFCFGRTNYENEGLRQYKNGWATTEKKIAYYEYNLKQGEFVGNLADKKTMGNAVLQKVPKSFLKTIGRILYRHIG